MPRGSEGLRGGPLTPLQLSKMGLEQMDMGSMNIPLFDNDRQWCQKQFCLVGPILKLL